MIEYFVRCCSSCFQDCHLDFVADPLYGASKGLNYPNHAYIVPCSVAKNENVGLSGDFDRFRLKLPDNLSGDLGLLQWHYLTANSCTFPGYDFCSFPSDSGNMGNHFVLCGALPPDGNDVPEQFWNCSEISIFDSNIVPSTLAPLPVPSPLIHPDPFYPYTSAPLPAPTTVGPSTPVGNGPCGDDNAANGSCLTGFWCSKRGYCVG